MDLKQLATELFLSKIGGQLDSDAVSKALSRLLGDGPEIDLPSLLSQLSGGGLAGAAKSWLGDGANDSVSSTQIAEGLGADRVSDFASQLGLSADDAANGLAGMIPDLINQNSKGGDLLGSLGGLGGLASKLLR